VIFNTALFAAATYYFSPQKPAEMTAAHQLYENGVYPFADHSTSSAASLVGTVNVLGLAVYLLWTSLSSKKTERVLANNQQTTLFKGKQEKRLPDENDKNRDYLSDEGDEGDEEISRHQLG